MMRSLRKILRPASFAGIGIALSGLSAAPARAGTSLVIRDFKLAHGIEQREPVGATEAFRVGDGRAIAFARIWNGGEPTRISFLWRRGEKIHASVPVTVGVSPAWRTWSTVKLQPGAWRVALVDSDGAVLAERAFTVEPAPQAPLIAPVMPAPANRPAPAIPMSRAPDDTVFSSEVPATAIYPGR